MNHHKANAAVRRILLDTILDTLKAARTTLTYSQVSNLIGLPARSGTFHDLLTQTMIEDHGLGHMPRCGLVVNKQTGRPGPEFYAQAKNAGYPVVAEDVIFHDEVLEAFGVVRPTPAAQ